MTQYFAHNLLSADINSFFLQPIVSLRGCDRTETRLMMFLYSRWLEFVQAFTIELHVQEFKLLNICRLKDCAV